MPVLISQQVSILIKTEEFKMITQVITFLFSLFQIINQSMPITDCNVMMTNGAMETGYRREYTVYSEDCTIDWNTARLQTFEDGSFVLSFVQPIEYKVFLPLAYNQTAKIGNPGFGFGCDIELDDVDHILITCESTNGEKFPYSPENEIQLSPFGDNGFVGCLDFGFCQD